MRAGFPGPQRRVLPSPLALESWELSDLLSDSWQALGTCVINDSLEYTSLVCSASWKPSGVCSEKPAGLLVLCFEIMRLVGSRLLTFTIFAGASSSSALLLCPLSASS